MVGRSTCPFCIEVTRTLADLGLTFPYFLVDKVRGSTFVLCLPHAWRQSLQGCRLVVPQAGTSMRD